MEFPGRSGDERGLADEREYADDLRATVIIPSMQQTRRPQTRKRLQWQVGVAVAMVLVTLSGASVLVGAASGRTSAVAATPTQRIVGHAATAPTQALTAAKTTPTATVARPTATTPRVPAAPAVSYDAAGEFCHDTTIFVANITQWTPPPGCYATIYSPNTAKFPYAPGFGYCNWWVREMHLSHPDITENTALPRGAKPVAGAVVWFDPNVQGASSAGHWAQVVAISPDGYWFLVSEMNFGWRGGGFGKVDYRYAHTGSGVEFVYAS